MESGSEPRCIDLAYAPVIVEYPATWYSRSILILSCAASVAVAAGI